MNFVRSFWIITLFSVSVLSCSDDLKLVEKKEMQKAEIIRLKGELAFIEEKLKTLPADVSTELAEAKQLSDNQAAELARLEKEVVDLEARKRSLESDFDAYRLKFKVK